MIQREQLSTLASGVQRFARNKYNGAVNVTNSKLICTVTNKTQACKAVPSNKKYKLYKK
jgi:hypothetical protein